ncbi:MAG TPA: pitrilysin family protein [Nitrospirota bacterium]|nr:pitrilysin family protein [Nitrospirota bacterium]
MKLGKHRLFFTAVSLFLLIPLPVRPSDKADVLRATLSNGLQVVIVENTLAPVVTTEVNYLVGSNESPEGFPGMAHAQEHMMFRGSPGLSSAQLANIMALMGGDFNADTQQTVTQYFLTVPSGDLDVALQVEAARMRDVLDTPELWDQERGAIEQEVAQDLSSPEYVFSVRLLAEMFAGTPYAHDALGTRPSFEKTTGTTLKQFYDSWYAPNNAVLIIVGDVDPQKTLMTVKELFEPIKKRPLPARPAVNLAPLQPATIRLETDLPYGMAVVAFRLPGYESPDFAAGMILGDVLDSRRGNLYALVPEGKALFTDFEGSILPKAGYGYAVAGYPQGEDGSALLTMMKNIVADYVKNGVPDDLVEASKRHELADAAFQKNSVSGLAAAWSQAVAVEGRTSPDDDLDAIRKVTAEDVNRVARQYLINDQAITAILTPAESGKPVTAKGFGGQESFTPKVTEKVELPPWAKKVDALPEMQTSTVNPVVMTLLNGIRLIVQPENISPTISLFGQVKSNADLQAPEGKDGVDGILGSLFSYGTASYDRLAFQKAQDDIGGDISAGTNFSLRVPADRFDRGIELLADNLLRPALPDTAFLVMKRETIDSLVGQLQSPAYRSRRALREALFPRGDAELRQSTPQTVATITLSDVKSYYAKVFRPDMTTMVIVGQITPEQARQTIEKYFSGWKASGPKPVTDYPPVPMNKPSASTVPDASRVQDGVTLAETIGITRTDPAYYKLQLGNTVLSGAFYASRLSRDLREKSGLVYSVGSFLEAQKTRSIFGVYFACDPPNVSKSRTIVVRDLDAIRTTLVTPDELHQAKILLLQQIPLSEASVASIASGLLARSLQGLPLDEPLFAARRYREITAEQVRDAYARWIRPSDFVQVTLGPTPE